MTQSSLAGMERFTVTGVVVMTSERRRSLRDRYVVTVAGGVLDGRVAAAMAVDLDALQSR